MSEHLEELAAAVRGVLASRTPEDSAAPEGGDTVLWEELDRLGFTSLSTPEELGGGGGTLQDAAAVVREIAEACAAVPVAEALLVAAPLLAAAEAPLPAGPLTVGVGDLFAEPTADGEWEITGSLPRVPWLRSVEYVVALVDTAEGMAVAVVPATHPRLLLNEGTNPAGEQRDDAVLDGVVTNRVYRLPERAWLREIEMSGAVARTVQMAGAARGVLKATLRHVREREQFGRPLLGFQVVQHRLASLAADVVTVEVAADAAILALMHADSGRELAVASAKAQASALARPIADAGHQLHGAIGFTMEHRLGAYTRRLWSWRDEYGNELLWQERAAQLVVDRGGDVWGLVTGADLSGEPEAGEHRAQVPDARIESI
ncbi:acyl-CoA dehydrogenase [Actinocorallia populi]|uniref:acyl-CoA dehydrogenase n=1 Tax=Actinocorallia populi TaxID=2079200 RepID=UPI000D0878B5|nr:acyl-CoA dehydrogenase [Actinocorallia populi]